MSASSGTSSNTGGGAPFLSVSLIIITVGILFVAPVGATILLDKSSRVTPILMATSTSVLSLYQTTCLFVATHDVVQKCNRHNSRRHIPSMLPFDGV